MSIEFLKRLEAFAREIERETPDKLQARLEAIDRTHYSHLTEDDLSIFGFDPDPAWWSGLVYASPRPEDEEYAASPPAASFATIDLAQTATNEWQLLF